MGKDFGSLFLHSKINCNNFWKVFNNEDPNYNLENIVTMTYVDKYSI